MLFDAHHACACCRDIRTGQRVSRRVAEGSSVMHSELPPALLCCRVLVIARVYLWHPRSLWRAASARFSHQYTRSICQIQVYDPGSD